MCKQVKMCFDDFHKIKTKFAHEKHMVRLSKANVQVCANVQMQMCKYTCIPYGLDLGRWASGYTHAITYI